MENTIATSERQESTRKAGAYRAVILLVEDNALLLKMVSIFLAQLGHTVMKAESALEAELAFAGVQGRIDVLLTDLDLGDGFGTDLAVRFKTIVPSLKVLLMSGRSAFGETLSVGQEEFPCLAKPFTRKQLTQRLAELMDEPTRDPH